MLQTLNLYKQDTFVNSKYLRWIVFEDHVTVPLTLHRYIAK
jgi:hypothetical protein